MSAKALVALTFLAFLQAANAAPPRGEWDEVQRLQKGAVVRVTATSDKTYRGTFTGLTHQSIVIVESKGEVSIAKKDVLRVDVKSKGRRTRNTLIGVGAGLAFGLVIDQTAGAYLRNETGESGGARAATVVLPAALFGGIGAVLPGYRTVYRAPRHRP
jgi:hypothetical protein